MNRKSVCDVVVLSILIIIILMKTVYIMGIYFIKSYLFINVTAKCFEKKNRLRFVKFREDTTRIFFDIVFENDIGKSQRAVTSTPTAVRKGDGFTSQKNKRPVIPNNCSRYMHIVFVPQHAMRIVLWISFGIVYS